MLKFIKNWTLPIAMLTGTLAYLVFAKWSFLAPLKPMVNGFVSFITPWLIFAQLLLTFCKMDLKELTPKRWHLWLLLIQFFSCALTAGVLLCVPMGELSKGIWEVMYENRNFDRRYTRTGRLPV